MQKICTHKISLLGLISAWLLIDLGAIYYAETDLLPVFHKSLMPLVTVDIVCLLTILFYVLKKR